MLHRSTYFGVAATWQRAWTWCAKAPRCPYPASSSSWSLRAPTSWQPPQRQRPSPSRSDETRTSLMSTASQTLPPPPVRHASRPTPWTLRLVGHSLVTTLAGLCASRVRLPYCVRYGCNKHFCDWASSSTTVGKKMHALLWRQAMPGTAFPPLMHRSMHPAYAGMDTWSAYGRRMNSRPAQDGDMTWLSSTITCYYLRKQRQSVCCSAGVHTHCRDLWPPINGAHAIQPAHCRRIDVAAWECTVSAAACAGIWEG